MPNPTKRFALVAIVVSLTTLAGVSTTFAQTAPVAPTTMSLAEMNALIDSLIAQVASLTEEISALSVQQTTVSTTLPVASSVDVDITIQNGKILNPSFTFQSSDQRSLLVSALDTDYTFTLAEDGISVVIKKGTKVEVPLETLGVGTHVFSCGINCGGTIIIQTEDDGDEPQN